MLVLGILLFTSVNSAFAQTRVDLEFRLRASISKPAQGVQSQFCNSASSDLDFQVKNLKALPLSLTASSLLVTLTITSGNTFLGSGSAVATRVFKTTKSGGSVIGGHPAPSSLALFSWTDALQFTNSGITTVTVSVAASDTIDFNPLNQSLTGSEALTLNILNSPDRPVLSSNLGLVQ